MKVSVSKPGGKSHEQHSHTMSVSLGSVGILGDFLQPHPHAYNHGHKNTNTSFFSFFGDGLQQKALDELWDSREWQELPKDKKEADKFKMGHVAKKTAPTTTSGAHSEGVADGELDVRVDTPAGPGSSPTSSPSVKKATRKVQAARSFEKPALA